MNIEESHRRSPPAEFRPVTPQPVAASALLKQQSPTGVPTQAALERTIRRHDSDARRPPFDFHFVSSDQQVRAILHSLTQAPLGDVVLINQPEQLFQDDLVQRLHITADGQYRQKPGRLFIGDLTLVLDIRALTCDELPTFNDLLDPEQPCLFDKITGTKRPLGTYVSVLVLAQLEQLQLAASHDMAPGGDFWRRVNRPDNHWQLPDEPGEPDNLLPRYPDDTVTGENTVTINCHLYDNWRRLLFGGPGVDSCGRISHIPGQLAQLHDGQKVILKGADWGDLAFEQAIRQLITRQQYQANGERQKLADNITFYRMPVDVDELGKLLNTTVSITGDAGQNRILINQANIAQWLNPHGISPEGIAVTNNTLTDQIRAGATLSVTSPLSQALWFQLLGAVNHIVDSTSQSPPGLTAISNGQPPSLEDALAKSQFTGPALTLKMVTFEQEAQATAWLDTENPLVIQISPLTTFNQLFDQLHIVSEQRARFARQRTGLQDALQQGKPVVLRGLESNPVLQQALEPLFCNQPLPVNGVLVTYPNADITVLWPAPAKSTSPLLSAAQATPCPKLDIWANSAAQHGITRAQLPEQAINKLYKAAGTIPRQLCQPLPALSEELLGNLILAARRAQKNDSNQTLEARHWRRAIDSILTHATREHSTTRDYLKVTCQLLLPDSGDWVDPERLQHLLGTAPQLNRQFVVSHLWSLARCFGPGVLSKCQVHLLPFSPPNFSGNRALDELCTLIVACSAPAQQQTIARQLQVEPGPERPNLSIRPSAQIRRLQDALAGGWQIKARHNHAQVIETLAADCFALARGAGDDALTKISQRLAEALTWQGSTEPPLSALADDLCHSRSNQADCLARRLSRLHQRMTDAPVIFLQGETGTGKSYFAASVAKTAGPAFIVSLGPCDSEQTLAKRWYWQENGSDRCMREENQTLMTWANTNATDKDNYVTLVLDEGNMATAGLLSALTGLWEPTPCIYVHGHPVMVSNRHRVIITGNPDSYTNRQTEPTLKAKIPCIHYPRLKEEFLREHVIKPALTTLTPGNQASTSNAIMALWQHYPQLLPERLFTPRDLRDICAWTGWYLTQSGATEPTAEQLHAVVLQCFRDLLNPQLSTTDYAGALESWFSVSYPPDFALVKQTHERILAPACQAFNTLTNHDKPEFDTSPGAVTELVHQLSQDLHRCQQAFHRRCPHGGRQATIIEGPPGRGKDVTLQLLLESVEQQVIDRGETMPRVYHLNACDCSWDTLRNVIKKAREEGGIVVIAEMNLIDSQYLEGELNDILAGDAHHGFHLFATVNPAHYGGRKPLSPALTGRFRHLPIRVYNPGELQAIAGKALPPDKQAQAVMLASWHCRLRRHLHNKNLPLFPTCRDLQTLATAINSGGDFSQPTLEESFNKHYQLYLLAAKTALDDLPGLPLATTPDTIDRPLCDWLHQTLPDVGGPWLIKRRGLNQLQAKQQTIRLKSSLNTSEAQHTIVTMLAQAQWTAASLPLEPKSTDPELAQAFYRLWQQRWFVSRFQNAGITPDKVFPITTAQQQLLATATAEHLEQITGLVNDFGQHSPRHWLKFNQSLRQCPANLRPPADTNSATVDAPKATGQVTELPTSTAPTTNSSTVTAVDKATGQVTDLRISTARIHPTAIKLLTTAGIVLLAPVALAYGVTRLCARSISRHSPGKSSKRPLDRKTDYEKQPAKQHQLTKHFNSDQHPTQYRLECKDLCVLPNGNIVLKDFPAMEVDVDMAAKVPGSYQVEGKITLKPVNGLCLLPGLMPDEDIVEMHTVPSVKFRLQQDQYSGLHRVRVPAGNRSITFTYTVQARESGRQSPSQPLQPDTHCSTPMKQAIETLFAHMSEYPQHQRQQLLAIKEATTTEQRIDAITHYCQQFSGHAKPTARQPLFLYLLQQRQGSCRHRVVAFVGLCRYFAIPSRIIHNTSHAFVECSLNQTWHPRDLGGAPCDVRIAAPQFSAPEVPLTRQEPGPSARQPRVDRQPSQTWLTTEAKTLFHVFNHASSEEQKYLANAIDVDTDTLCRAARNGTPLPTADESTAEVIIRLWKNGGWIGLSLGVDLLKAMGVLDTFHKRMLIGNKCQVLAVQSPLAGALIILLSTYVDTDRLLQRLADIYKTVVVNSGVHPLIWQNLLSLVLMKVKPGKLVDALAREALETGWIDVKQTSDSEDATPSDARDLFMLLHKLREHHEELKTLADGYIKRWHQQFIRPRYDISWQCGQSTILSHSLSGHSPQLDSWLTVSSLNSTWSDEPEGVPDIGRLLAQVPAYRRTTSAQNHRRPVIIIGNPKWDQPCVTLTANRLLDLMESKESDAVKRHSAIMSTDRRNSLQYNHCARDADSQRDVINLFKQQFCQYFFQKMTANGNQLHYCWFDAKIKKQEIGYGSHQPSSPRELLAMFTGICDVFFPKDKLDHTLINKALNTSNALILSSDDFTPIIEEYLNSIDLDLLSHMLAVKGLQ